MFDKDNSCDEILNAILKDRPLDEQNKILRQLFTDAVSHGWVDDDLRDSILKSACKEYDVPYTSIEDEDLDEEETDLE